MVNNFLSSKWINILLIIISTFLLITLSTYLLYYYKIGLDTVWDEGFYMLWLNEKKNFLQYSQSYHLINSFLSYFKYQLIEFRFITLFLKYLYLLIFLFLLQKIGKHLNISIKPIHLLIISLSFLPSFLINSKVFCYREIQQFSFLSIWLLSLYNNKTSNVRWVQYFLLSFAFILSLINIPPSGLINFVVCIIFILVYHKPTIKEVVEFAFVGILTFLLINFTLSDLISNYKSIILNGLVISKGDNTHSVASLVLMFIQFFKSFLDKYLIIILLLLISLFIQNKIFKFFVIISALVYSFYNFSFSSDFLILLFILMLSNLKFFKRKSKNNYLYLFLLIVPLSAVFGSSVAITLNLYYYLPIWVILQIILTEKNTLLYKQIFFGFTMFFILVSFIKLNDEYGKYLGNPFNSKEYLGFNSKINKIKITINQKKYFLKINTILKKTKFNKNKDYFFSLNQDLMTVYLFDGKLCTKPYHQVGVYIEDKKYDKPKIKPKYIFLDESGAKVVSKNNNWSFPETYQKYYLGCPDAGKVNRSLYVFK